MIRNKVRKAEARGPKGRGRGGGEVLGDGGI